MQKWSALTWLEDVGEKNREHIHKIDQIRVNLWHTVGNKTAKAFGVVALGDWEVSGWQQLF